MAPMPPDEYPNRIGRARALMREHGMDGLIVTDPMHYSYYTGHKIASWMRSRPSVFVLPLDGEPALITWSGPGMFARLYKQPFPSWVEDRRIYPEVPFNKEPRVDWGVADIIKERGLDSGALGIELGRETWLGIAVVDFELLKEQLPKARFVDSSPVVWGCRLIKSEWEIDCMRQACEIGGVAWHRAFQDLRPGMARPSARQQSEHDGMWGILNEIIERMKPGVSMRELFEYSQSRLAQHPEWRNYSDHPSKRIGHGIGLENEPPSISATDDTILEVRMALTPEPKIESVDGLLNPEEQVVIRPSGCEILSAGSDWKLHIVA